MKLVIAFLRLIRWMNLVFIVLTQTLFQYCIAVPLFAGNVVSPAIDLVHFILLCSSSVLIAAAGYIINDYFDLNIDRINKPGKVVVEKLIKRRWAIIWHWMLSFLGVIIGFYLGHVLDVFWLGFANAACVAALWFYSTTFKRKLLTGNILISLLTAWVVLVVGFVTHYRLLMDVSYYGTHNASKLLRFTFLYAGFAFIISLVREVIKDVEDMRGDSRYGARTMPVVWGVLVSKIFAGTWLAALATMLLIVFAYVLQFKWWLTAAYCFLFVIIPLLAVTRKLIRAHTVQSFHELSIRIKFIMFTGILSMLFF